MAAREVCLVCGAIEKRVSHLLVFTTLVERFPKDLQKLDHFPVSRSNFPAPIPVEPHFTPRYAP